ncbi:MAG: ATP-binding cassette domain-containing protein, partial [Chthonomonadaceae bacterium]|nr:ATP-binding cassette domain-containing protein [Chthonomonadaceae bacterium]
MSLHVENVSLSYGDGDTLNFAVRGVTLSIPGHGFYGIMGPSGSGKSSLLYLMSGLKLPTGGQVLYRGQSLSAMSERERVLLRRRHFGFVFQQPYLIHYLTARENILVAAPDAPGAPQQVDALMEALHIAHLADRTPAHLSGGERQRIVVARAMIHCPEVIFA